jgi:hypothetical protein
MEAALNQLRFYKCTGSLFPAAALALMLAGPAIAHCDSMDGPVVKDAQRALADKTVEPVLKWVRAEDEDEVRKTFEMTLAVRNESDKARHVADRYFFETLIRVHRASEGEGFTGLKPAGSTDPAIAAADRALTDGNVDRLADELAAAVRNGVKERFAEAYDKRQSAEKSVAQGRDYVQAYVQFTHFAEGVHNLAAEGASHKHREGHGALLPP